MDRFQQKISQAGQELRKGKVEILQINLGKLCNLTCSHCHVEAGPTKIQENMSLETARAVARFMDLPSGITTLDLTGGAPELNANFRYLVMEGRKRNLRVIDRCNLTVFYEPGMEDLPEFLRAHNVEIVASLPCYQKDNVDQQRGNGTFNSSIEALRCLNHLGYGQEDSGLILNLVYNPVGAHLPPPQTTLERDYKRRLREDWGIVFNHLFTITNMPITRYAKYLKALGQYESYVELLIQQFNINTLKGLMCRNTLSVGWDGKLYDCDFNQMLGMEMKKDGRALRIGDIFLNKMEIALDDWEILTGNHCFGCSAGAGSSCQGALE